MESMVYYSLFFNLSFCIFSCISRPYLVCKGRKRGCYWSDPALAPCDIQYDCTFCTDDQSFRLFCCPSMLWKSSFSQTKCLVFWIFSMDQGFLFSNFGGKQLGDRLWLRILASPTCWPRKLVEFLPTAWLKSHWDPWKLETPLRKNLA